MFRKFQASKLEDWRHLVKHSDLLIIFNMPNMSMSLCCRVANRSTQFGIERTPNFLTSARAKLQQLCLKASRISNNSLMKCLSKSLCLRYPNSGKFCTQQAHSHRLQNPDQLGSSCSPDFFLAQYPKKTMLLEMTP